MIRSRSIRTLAVREDAPDPLRLSFPGGLWSFTKLITVSGIGPKVAQGIPFRVKGGRFPACHQESGCEIPDQASRHWKKTAERMLLELKDLTGPEGPLPESNGGFLAPEGPASALTETMEALASLGYTQNEISGVMNRIKVTADMSAGGPAQKGPPGHGKEGISCGRRSAHHCRR